MPRHHRTEKHRRRTAQRIPVQLRVYNADIHRARPFRAVDVHAAHGALCLWSEDPRQETAQRMAGGAHVHIHSRYDAEQRSEDRHRRSLCGGQEILLSQIPHLRYRHTMCRNVVSVRCGIQILPSARGAAAKGRREEGERKRMGKEPCRLHGHHHNHGLR